MTAIVAVLNKHAVAIAADSAVTMGDTHKVVNSGNKIFTLSKYHPVAIMTYSNASLMGVPWDIIIKQYRKDLNDKCFPHVHDYVEDFIEYLRLKHYFCDNQTQHEFLELLITSFYDININVAKKNNGGIVSDFSLIEKELIGCMDKNKNDQKCKPFDTYGKDEFDKYARTDYDSFYTSITDIQIPDKSKQLFEDSFYCYISITIITAVNTGLVFVGYGEDDIYPSLFPINVSIAIDNNLRYYEDKSTIIDEHKCDASICPFAQVDVIQTIIRGINPVFYNITSEVISKSVEAYSGEIVKLIKSKEGNEDIAKIISNFDIDDVSHKMIEQIQDAIFSKYSSPLINTVSSLDKEDMANMAESFISLTSLVRRMSPHEETVGGPVDVAVISKGDGFIWINRKHYFKPELNNQFFENYYK